MWLDNVQQQGHMTDRLLFPPCPQWKLVPRSLDINLTGRHLRWLVLHFLTLFGRIMHFKNRNSLYVTENKMIDKKFESKFIILNKDKSIPLHSPRNDAFLYSMYVK